MPEAVSEPSLYRNLADIYNSLRILQAALDKATGKTVYIGADRTEVSPIDTIISGELGRLYVICDDTCTAGSLLNIYGVTGVLHARLADGANALKFYTGVAAEDCITSGDVIEIRVICGALPYYTGLIPGALYFLSTVPGAITLTAPTGSGTIRQAVGQALTANILLFQPTLLFVVNP
jgi:hypothetical protein